MITAVQNDLPSNGDAGIENCNRASVASSSAVTSGNAGDLRRREVVLAKISLYMVFVFLICHSVKIVPNIYEMVQTYLEVRCFLLLPSFVQKNCKLASLVFCRNANEKGTPDV